MEENNWLKKELRRIELTRKAMNDNYSTLEKPIDLANVENKHYLPHKFAPQQGQTWESYVQQLKIYIKFATEKNASVHINGPRGSWYTHRSSPSCFMCEDVDLHHVMLHTMEMMSKQYPKQVF